MMSFSLMRIIPPLMLLVTRGDVSPLHPVPQHRTPFANGTKANSGHRHEAAKEETTERPIAPGLLTRYVVLAVENASCLAGNLLRFWSHVFPCSRNPIGIADQVLENADLQQVDDFDV